MTRAYPAEKPGDIPPTKVRWQRGEVERHSETVQDFNGSVGDPYRAIDTLTLLERHGTITPEMHQAGDRFHSDFITAGFEQLRAAALEHIPSGNHRQNVTGAQIDARNLIAANLIALGGQGSACGCCAWFVLGLQLSLKQWAQREGWRQRSINLRVATGILVGTLGVLTVKYDLAPR